MAKRGRKKKFKLKFSARTQTIRSIIALSLLGASLLIVVLTFVGIASDKTSLQIALSQWFGFSFFLLAPPLFVLGLLLINNVKWRIAEFRVFIGTLLFFISCAGLFHSFYVDEGADAIEEGLGGGKLGYFLASFLSEYITIYGTALIFFVLAIVSIILVLDKSIEEIVEGVTGFKLGNLLPFLNKENAPSVEDDTEILSGIPDAENTDEQSDKIISSKTSIEPKFEIVPNIDEPLEHVIHTPADDGKTIGTIAPGVSHGNTNIWEPPPLDLLDDSPAEQADRGDVKQQIKIIEDTLASFNINAKVTDTRFGPSVTQYALRADAGTKISAITNLQYDLAAALASPTGSVRIEAPIPGRSEIGIEVPNRSRVTVYFKELLTSDAMKKYKDKKLAVVLGRDVGGVPMAYDIAKMPHLLIAGATGSGKSVFIHNLMFSILFRASPDECKFLLVDPKRVELKHYDEIPHLIHPVIVDVEKAPAAFNWATEEMNKRYKLLETARVKNIESYNEKAGFQAMPYIVIIVDELGEIMVVDQAAVEKSIIRLAQLSRAVGIHLVLAMQRPTTNIITGLIKANIPCRIAFNVTGQIDSRVILDQPGAEKLLGNGDMLFVPPDSSKPVRIQGALVKETEINKLVNYLKSTGFEPQYVEGEITKMSQKDSTKSISAGGESTDELFDQALEIILSSQKASASLLQRKLTIGYSRAARILDELEQKGFVGPAKGAKPREILVDSKEYFSQIDETPQEPTPPTKNYPSISGN